jgi:class 3 adenylate cyclase
LRRLPSFTRPSRELNSTDMGLREDLKLQIKGVFANQWSIRDGKKVPESEDLKLSNDGVSIDATVLYADMADSTGLVDSYEPEFCAEIYKTYLYSAAKIIRSHNGAITAYDGDRVMAIFVGNYKNSSAAKAALQINYAVLELIQPALNLQYPKSDYILSHSIGIDTSMLVAARTGIRGSNDLVWVGRAANYAAKLTSVANSSPIRITTSVFKKLSGEAKFSGDRSMWKSANLKLHGFDGYQSSWRWEL